MNKGDDGTDFAQNGDLVQHEVGHTLGLQDPPKNAADLKKYHSTGGVMDYTNTGSQHRINSNDITSIFRYAQDAIAYQRSKASVKNSNFEGRANVGLVATTEMVSRALAVIIKVATPVK